MDFPFKYQAVTLPAYNANLARAILSLQIAELEMTDVADDEVIIKVHASTINPSDIAFLRGGYNIKKPLPAIPGFEASGEVVAAGKNHSNLNGKFVACFAQDDESGCWAQYIKTKGANCIVLFDNFNLDQAACFSINPMTAQGLFSFFDIRSQGGIVLTAAGSRVADFVRKFAELNYVKTINIIRSVEKADILRNQLSSDYHKVIAINDENSWMELQQELNGSKAWLALDAVGGDFAGKLFNLLPNGSSLVVYGALSEGDINGIDPLNLIFNRKKLIGFDLNEYVKNKKQDSEFDYHIAVLQQMVFDKLVVIPIAQSFPMNKISLALREYIKNMSKGKILIKPFEE